MVGIWYFGINCGVTFAVLNGSGDPTPLTNGPINANEGSSVFLDNLGNYLISTDGLHVYNNVPNGPVAGTDIGVSLSAGETTSGAIFLRNFNNPNQVYIFQSSELEQGFNKFRYSIYDLTTKNIVPGTLNTQISTNNIGEKICVVTGSTPNTKYLIVHEAVEPTPNDVFLVYRFDTTGISLVQTFHSGIPYTNNGGTQFSAVGFLRANNKGQIVDMMHFNGWALYDFDNTTGRMSNSRSIETGDIRWYGSEFSPDGTKVYAATSDDTPDHIYQYDISSGVIATIQASKFTVFTSTGGEAGGALALGPNGRIYYVISPSTALSVINNPNISGSGCNFNKETVPLAGRVSRVGLPTFDLAVIEPSAPPSPPFADFTVNNNVICQGQSVVFTDTSQGNLIAWSWNFGAGASPATDNTSGPVTVTYSTPGLKDISLMVVDNFGLQSTSIMNNMVNVIAIPAPLTITRSGKILSVPTISGITYQWYKDNVLIVGATASSYTVSSSGSYTIVGSNSNGCSSTSEVVIIEFGCTDPNASNFDSTANVEDGSCTYISPCLQNSSNYLCCIVNKLYCLINKSNLGTDITDEALLIAPYYFLVKSLVDTKCTTCLDDEDLTELLSKLETQSGCNCNRNSISDSTIRSNSIGNINIITDEGGSFLTPE